MSYEWDHTEDNPYAKKVYDLLETKRVKLWSAAHDVDSSSRFTDGVQAFALLRMEVIKLLEEYIGQEEADAFSKLPAAVLKQHPAMLDLNYRYREYSKQEVENHISFVWAIMRRIKEGTIVFNGIDVRRKRELVLSELYNSDDTETTYTSFDELVDNTGIEFTELYSILEYLKGKNLIREQKLDYTLTVLGLNEVKKMSTQETSAQLRYRVLRTLYDLAPNNKHGDVLDEELAKAMGLSIHELSSILEYWKEKDMVRYPSDQSTSLTSNAIDEIEQSISNPNRPTRHFSASTIHYFDNSVNVGGDNSGQVQGGQHNTQNVISPQPIGDLLPKLAELISAVRQADFPDKEDVVADLEKVRQLAQGEQTEGVWKRIQTKLNAAKTTMEIAGLAYNSLPYWPAIWNFFHNLPMK